MLAAAGGLWTRGCAIDWAAARGLGDGTPRLGSHLRLRSPAPLDRARPAAGGAGAAASGVRAAAAPRPLAPALARRLVPRTRVASLAADAARVARRPLAGAGQRLDPDGRRCRPGRCRRRDGDAGAPRRTVRAAGGRQLLAGLCRFRRFLHGSWLLSSRKAGCPITSSICGHSTPCRWRRAARLPGRPGIRQPACALQGPAGSRRARAPALDGGDRGQPGGGRRSGAASRARAGSGPVPGDPARNAECARPSGRPGLVRHLVGGNVARHRPRSRASG